MRWYDGGGFVIIEGGVGVVVVRRRVAIGVCVVHVVGELFACCENLFAEL